ncbi:MAG: hypothetical protein ACYS8W_13965, partial [Planctomycetota bacterium]
MSIKKIIAVLLLIGTATLFSGCGGAGVGAAMALWGDEDDDGLYFSPASVSITTPSGSPIQNDVAVQFNLAHPFSTNTSVIVEYYNYVVGLWSLASISAGAPESMSDLATSPGGTMHIFLWDSRADLGHGIHDGIRVRISPVGGLGATTSDFTVDNTEPPVLTITGFTPAVQEYGDISINFTVSDFESDNVWVQVRYSLDGGATFPPDQTANRAAGLGNSMYNLET